MSDINVIETIPDKNSFFNIKRFNLKGIGKDFSIKTIDSNNISKMIFEEGKIIKNKNIIFEKSKIIKDFDSIKNIVNENSDSKVGEFFGRKAWLDDKFTLFHSTLKFNPYNYVRKVDEMSGFLNYYYAYSKYFVLVPNVLKHFTPYDNEGKASKTKVEIVSLDDYIKLVDELYDFFEQMNNKPIFVPISLKLSMGELTSLISHYIKKERFYFWIDFESAPANLSNATLGGKIGQINRLLRNSKQFDKMVVIATNVKREIISNPKDNKSPASDVLTTLCGANIVGVDREPARVFKIKEEDKKKIIQHKSRIFNEQTYYYNIRRETKPNKPLNVTTNSVKLSEEFDKQRKHFLDNMEISGYLKTKDMLRDYLQGKILRSLKPNIKEFQKRLF